MIVLGIVNDISIADQNWTIFWNYLRDVLIPENGIHMEEWRICDILGPSNCSDYLDEARVNFLFSNFPQFRPILRLRVQGFDHVLILLDPP